MRLKKLERKLKDGCDMSDRKNAITKMLLNVKYPTEDEFNGAVEAFARSNLKIEEIESLARSMSAQPNDIPVRRHAGVL